MVRCQKSRTMNPQSSIAHYRITSKLGGGGMGTVYRATDTKLNREVAIKILSEMFAANQDRLARFTREALVLASLNHPNIATIYGVEDNAIVMEFVEGENLRGPRPLDEALSIARQIAEALEYAHERGIVHRDLKPENIKVTPTGRVKILDFGLAKALSIESESGDPMTSSTLTMGDTVPGLILGTAGYMPPEQAKGKPVDRRADIWAFGVILTEVLTGRTLYRGGTISETLADVIKDRPDLSGLPTDTPPAIRRLLQRCLEKDPSLRLQAIGEARIAIDAPSDESITQAQQVIGSPLRWIMATAACAAIASVLGVLLWIATRPVDRPMMLFSIDLGPGAVSALESGPIISPDGTRLVFPARGAGGIQQLATRQLNQPNATFLAGTEGAYGPFFSPDGQWIGFLTGQKMKKISVQGGPPVSLCDVSTVVRGAVWGENDTIIASLDNRHLFRVPKDGGKPQMLAAKPEDHSELAWRWPQFLPGGRKILFTGNPGAGGYEDASLEMMDLETGQVKTVHRGGYFGRYVPSGHLIYVQQGRLFALRFNGRQETKGVPVPVLEDVAGVPGHGAGRFEFSHSGTLVYVDTKSASVQSTLVWMDSTGKQERLFTSNGVVVTPRLSPDGQRLAFSIGQDIWVYDVKRDTSTRITFTGAQNRNPVWMPDGQHIIFGQGTDYGIWWIRADGSGQPQKLLAPASVAMPTSVFPDGSRLAFYQADPDTSLDLWTLPLDLSDPDHPKTGVPQLFLREQRAQNYPAFSPDGRWIAYSSAETGSMHVFVRPFPGGPSAGKWQISSDSGGYPVWSRSSQELYFLSGDHIMVARYRVAGNDFLPEKARPWVSKPIKPPDGNLKPFDLTADGKRAVVFPAVEAGGSDKTVHVTVVLNFFDELRRRVPVE